MTAADTNVILRLIPAHAAQVAAIRTQMARDEISLSLSVLLEPGWVLESRYRMPRAAVDTASAGLLALDRVEVARHTLAGRAVDRYRDGADLADMGHLAAAAKLGGFATLDPRLARDAGSAAPVAVEALG